MEQMLIGLDLGTSSVKAECFDPDLYPHCRYSEPVELRVWHDKNITYAEQDLENIYHAVLKVLSMALGEASRLGVKEVFVGLSGQAPGLVIVDKNGNALTPYISWIDRRAVEEVPELSRGIGESALREKTGLRPDPLFTGPKLMWIIRKKPEVMEKAWKALQLRDAIFLRLTGHAWTDHTHASETLMYNLRTGKWDEEIISMMRLDPELLPEIRESTEGAELRKDLLLKTSTNALRVRIYLGCVDSVCSHLVTESGLDDVIVDTTGTSTCINFSLEKPELDPWGAFEVYRHVIPRRFVGEASLPTGGRGLEYILELLGLDWGQLARIDPSPSDVVMLPFLEGTRSPDWNPELRGAIYGMSLSSRKEDYVKAYLQGVALWMRYVISLLEKWKGKKYNKIRVVGGGSRISQWNIIKAGITGKIVEKYYLEDASTLGAAVTAFVGEGIVGWNRVYNLVNRITDSYNPAPTWQAWVGTWERMFLGIWRVLSGSL